MTIRILLACVALCIAGHAVAKNTQAASSRAFSFKKDTFPFDNETVWKYQSDPDKDAVADPDEGPTYTLHCFVLSRSARQFFQFARFDAALPRVSDDRYRDLIREVIAHDPSETEPLPAKIVIPGYAGLRSFGTMKEAMLKAELGSAAESFLQRGNWRMVFPFSHDHQEDTANSLLAKIRQQRPPVVHLVTFPKITINHAVLLFGAVETPGSIVFQIYDPNRSAVPARLSYDRAKRSFTFPRNKYFPGGEVDVYEVYKSAVY